MSNDIDHKRQEVIDWFYACHSQFGKIERTKREQEEIDLDMQEFRNRLQELLDEVAYDAYFAGFNRAHFAELEDVPDLTQWKQDNLNFENNE